MYYINFEPINGVKDEQLIGRKVLAYGSRLKKNEYKGKNTSELVIKSNQYIEFLGKN